MKKNILKRLLFLTLALVLVAGLPMQAKAASSVSINSTSGGFKMTITNLTADGTAISDFNSYSFMLFVTNKSSATNPGGYTFSYKGLLENRNDQKQFVNFANNSYTGSFVWTDCTQPLNVSQTHQAVSQVGTKPPSIPIDGTYTWKATFTRAAYSSHDLITVTTKEPTCTTAGEQKVICSRCAYVKSTTILQPVSTAHAYTYTNLGNDKHKAVCAHNAAHTLSEDNCSGGTATCIAKATCLKCGTAYGDTLSHSWTDWTYDADAFISIGHYRTCTVCNPGGSTGATGYEFELNHSYTGASCVQKGKCKCGKEDQYGSHTYTHTKDGDTIQAVCANSSAHNATISLVPDSTVSTVYTGSEIKPLKAQITGYQQVSAPISYSNNINVGTTAKGTITIGNVSIERSFEITPATMTDEQRAADYTGTYDAQAHGINTSNLPAGSTVYYKDSEAGEYSATPVTRTNAGTTKVWYKVTNPNYLDQESTATITINPASISTATVYLTPAAIRPYSGSALVPGVSVSSASFGTLAADTDYEVSWDKTDFVYPGNYQLTVMGKGNFTGEAINVYTIKEADLTGVSVTQTNVLTYNGAALTPAVDARATTVDNAEVTFTYSTEEERNYGAALPSFTEAGEHTVYYTASAPNHNVYRGSFTAIIGKAVPTLTEPAAVTGLVYDGASKELIIAGSSDHGSFQYSLTGNEGEWSDSIPTAVGGGEYTVYWKLTGDKNHNDATGTVTATIARAALPTDIAFNYTAPTLTYNGQEQGVTVTLITDLPGVEAEDITLNYSATPKNAGDYTFTVSVAKSDNYEASTEPLTNENWKFTIGKATPVISWDTTEFAYNSRPQGEATVTLVNEEVYTGTIFYFTTIRDNYTRSGLPTDAGTYTVKASILGQDNYYAASNQATIVIKAKEVIPTVVIEPEYFTYDGTAKEPNVKVMDGETEIAPDEYTLTYENTTQVGAATVTVSDAADDNYTIDTVGKVYLILPDTSALDGVTTDNVNSGHQAAIDEIQAAMADKEIGEASEEAQKQWDALLALCTALENKIRDAETGIEAITTGAAALPEQPTTNDLHDIQEMLDQYVAIEGNLTEEEKETLADEIEKLEGLKDAITDTNADLKEITDGNGDLDKDDLDFADKAVIADLQKKIDDLESNPYLTDTQKQTLADVEEKLEELEAEFAQADKVTEQLNQLPTTADPDTETAVEAYEAAREAYEDLDEDKAKVDPDAVKKLDALKAELTDYEIIKGNGARWVKGSSNGLSFTANGYFDNFTGVKIDGKFIDSDNYTAKSGSTIVNLKASYLEKLKTGKYTIAICYGDGDFTGEATGSFKVVTSNGSPFTGDNSNIFLWSGMAMSSLLGLAMMVMFVLGRKRKYQR